MAKCKYCGGTITFRKVDGKIVPIHLTGGCSTGGYHGYRKPAKRLPAIANSIDEQPRSFLNPNARCPVCNENVFFFQCPNGGRVFFDDVGWPWPKHPCTDRLQHDTWTRVSAASSSSQQTTDWTKDYKFLRLKSVNYGPERTTLQLTEVTTGFGGLLRALFTDLSRSYSFSTEKLHQANLTQEDFTSAPNFVIKLSELQQAKTIVHFICARKGKIIKLRMKSLN